MTSLRGGVGKMELALLALLCGVAAGSAGAADEAGEVELLDAIEITVIDTYVVAFDVVEGDRIRTELQLGEKVLWTGARGQVGVAITDRRALGVAGGSSKWQEVPLQIDERPPADAILGQRVAIFATDRRALGFHSGGGGWIEASFTPRERVAVVRAGAGTALVVTNRRALGVSREAGGFFEHDLEIREKVEVVTAGPNAATITTSRRVLVFSGATGIWSSQRRNLN